MVDMEIINDAELLNNIRLRYRLDLICTYVGPTLLVVNPFQPVPKLFNPDLKKHYIDQIIKGDPQISSISSENQIQIPPPSCIRCCR
jgi:myosin heavy subunit